MPVSGRASGREAVDGPSTLLAGSPDQRLPMARVILRGLAE